MAAASDAPAKAAAAEDAADRELKRLELLWRIRVAKADLIQKVFISIVGAAVAGIFYVFQANQTQSRYYSDLQAQRERADTDLRASMFKTLFEAYFKNKIEAAQKAAASGEHTPAHDEALLVNLGQEIMLSDLLARNFETIDVRPMFEDLDRRLTVLVERGGKRESVSAVQIDAFRQREELRRVAYGATTRQIELLRANAGAVSQQVRVEQCQAGPASPATFDPQELPVLPGKTRGVISRVGDGSVGINLSVPTAEAAGKPAPTASAGADAIVEASQPREVPVTVTYFDMPTLENVRLPGGLRMALTITRSGSTRTCERFSAQMDESTRLDCEPQAPPGKAAPTRACSWANLTITLIPKDYIGMRDRPYLSELSTQGNSLFKDLFKGRPSDEAMPVPR